MANDLIGSSDLFKEVGAEAPSKDYSYTSPSKSIQITGYTEPEKFSAKQSYGTPARLLDNTIQVESSGNPHAVNPESGAMGVGQFMPETVAMLHKQGIEFNPFKADEARAAMDYYISHLAKKHGGDYTKAMSEYGGFKTKDPSKYLAKVLEGVDNTQHDADLISSNKLMEEAGNLNIPESELKEPEKLTAGRVAGLVTRGMAPAVTGAAAGQLVAGPAGALVGSMALPAGDILNTGINAVTGGINKYAGTNIPQLQMPSQIAANYMTKAGLPVAETTGERMIESAGSALGGTAGQLPALSNLARTATSPAARALAEQFAQAPISQTIAAPLSAAVGQGVGEKTNNPYLGMAAGMATAAPFGFRLRQEALNTPTQQYLADEAKSLYASAENSGVKFNSKEFANHMDQVGKDLRKFGYAENSSTYSGIKGALDELKDSSRPKDYLELQALREIIAGEQVSQNPKVRMLAGKLKDEFDDYILNAPESHLQIADKKGLLDWQSARKSYNKLKKAEVFDDMLEQASIEGKNLYTKSGEENSLAKQLRQLTNNPKRMRTFTPEEQEEIKKAARGGNIQNVLKLFGKFAPDSPIAGIPAFGGIVLNPYVGIPAALAASGSKYAATQMRKNDVSVLADMMRLGQKPELTTRTANVPATALRGLLSGAPTPKGQ